MSVWSKYPFVRMLIPFALGIWCWVCLPSFRLPLSTLVGIALGLFAVASLTAFVLKTYRLNWIFGAVIYIYLFLVGYALTCVQEAENQKDYFKNILRYFELIDVYHNPNVGITLTPYLKIR